jgi:hypothetical protein
MPTSSGANVGEALTSVLTFLTTMLPFADLLESAYSSSG